MIKKRTKTKLDKLVTKYLDVKKILIVLILLFLLLLFSKAFKGLLLLLIFIPMAKYSVRITRFVNYITLETFTASAITMGYLYGPKIGLLSGLFLGLYGYLTNSVTKFLAMIDVFLAGAAGAAAGYFISYPFGLAFTIGILVKNVLGLIIFYFADSDQIQNITYRTTHTIWNIAVVKLFFELVYFLYNLL